MDRAARIRRGGVLLASDDYLLHLHASHRGRAGETDPDDYKIFCFDGEPKVLFVATDRASGDTKFDFFDPEWNHMPFINGHPNASRLPEKPGHLSEMLDYAKVLSEGFPHVRVDFYEVGGKVYFGEMTFYHWSGLVPFNPVEWDLAFGEWIDLPQEG